MANITGKPEDMANITGTGFREEFRKKKFGLTHDSPALFVSAQCFGQFVYLLWSGFSALFFFSMLMLDIYYSKDEGPEYLRFLTNLTYIFQNATLILDFINTIYVFFNRADIKNGKSSEMTWYLTIQWLMFNVTNTMSLTVSCLYFAALNPAFTHGSINTHLLNSVHTLTNIMICAKPVQILHVYQPMIYALIYLTFSVIYHLAGADPIYEPLDWSDTGITTGLGLLMILVLIPLIHIVFFSFYTFRVYVSQKCCKKSSRVEPEPEAVNQNVTTRNRSVAIISDTITFTHGSINTHLLNSVHTLTNIMICAKPVQILHVYQPMIYALIYLTFSVIYHLAGADPIYEPLDWSDTGITTGLGLLMILVLIPLIHIVFFSFYTFRVYVSQKCCKKSTRVEPEPEAVNQNVTTRNRSVAIISDTISNSA